LIIYHLFFTVVTCSVHEETMDVHSIFWWLV
jgi:hypothetical protein